MAKGVQGDGVWFEGAWGYHLYTLSALWPLAEAARNSGIDLYGDPLKKMFLAPILLAMPNLMLPAFNDSTESPVRNNLYELAYARYRDPVYLRALSGANRRNEHSALVRRRSDSGRGSGAGGEPQRDGLGIRDSRACGGTWLCLKYGPHGGGHGHPDKNNFILFGGGRVLFPDPGTRPLRIAAAHRMGPRHRSRTTRWWSTAATRRAATGKSLAFGRTTRWPTRAPSIRACGLSARRRCCPRTDRLHRSCDSRSPAHVRSGSPLRRVVEGTATWRKGLGGVQARGGHDKRRAAAALRTDKLAVFLADNEPTEVITATGPGKSTAERIPMSSSAAQEVGTTYVWAVRSTGRP